MMEAKNRKERGVVMKKLLIGVVGIATLILAIHLSVETITIQREVNAFLTEQGWNEIVERQELSYDWVRGKMDVILTFSDDPEIRYQALYSKGKEVHVIGYDKNNDGSGNYRYDYPQENEVGTVQKMGEEGLAYLHARLENDWSDEGFDDSNGALNFYVAIEAGDLPDYHDPVFQQLAVEWTSDILRGNEDGLEAVNVLIYLEDLKGELLLWASSEGVVEVN